MSHAIIITKRANEDINKIIAYYDEKSKKTSKSFTKHLITEFDSLSENPSAYPIYFSKVRKKVMGKFPFNIFFKIKPRKKQVIIARVWHQKRNPRSLILK